MRAFIGGLVLCLSGTTVMAEKWSCKNDMEIQCDSTACEVSDSFTPMDVALNTRGTISVCAYSGCLEGNAVVTTNDRNLVFTARDLPFSSSVKQDGSESAFVLVDRTDGVGFLKMASFAHPLICSKS